jgi:hypothetical protein
LSDATRLMVDFQAVAKCLNPGRPEGHR